MSEDLSEDRLLGGRLVLAQPRRGHRAGSDALLVAAFARVAPGMVAGDFGAGVGTIALALLAREPGLRAVLFEQDTLYAALARRNLAANGMAERAQVVEGDLTRSGSAPPHSLDLIVMNPPFHPPEGRRSPDERTDAARAGGLDLLEAWARAAARMLAGQGRIVLIHRPDQLRGVLDCLEGRFGGIELLPVHPRADEPAVRLLIRARKGSRAPLHMLPGLVLNGPGGGLTAEADAVHRGEALLGPA